MGDSGLIPRLRFLRSWEEPSGAGMADVAVDLGALVSRGRAWRWAGTAEFDLSQLRLDPSWVTDAETLPRLLDAIAGSPMGSAAKLRLLLPAAVNPRRLRTDTWQPAAVRFGFCAMHPVTFPRVDLEGLKMVPVRDLGWPWFLDLLRVAVEPADVGLGSAADLEEMAWALWSGGAVEGAAGCRGFAISGPTGPFAFFFTGSIPGKGTSVGFAGVLPQARGAKRLVAALRLASSQLERTGAYPLWLEVESTNRRSVALAARIAGPPAYVMALYRLS